MESHAVAPFNRSIDSITKGFQQIPRRTLGLEQDGERRNEGVSDAERKPPFRPSQLARHTWDHDRLTAMRNNWLVQGLISNWVSSLIVVGGGAVIVYLTKQGSQWVVPILYGLSGTALILFCIVLTFKFLFVANPRNIETRLRTWLDHAQTSTKTVEIPDCIFNYHVVLNGKIFIIAQFKSHPEYIHFHTDLSFTEEDNKMIEKLPGGLFGAIRAIRLFLALKEISHSGIEAPLKKIVLSKRLLITSDLNEDSFINALYTVEAALNVVLAIIAPENPPATKPSVP